ncbi:transcriptional regulator medusa [Colletotrichum tofieldiae]|nr:transcriptional regulator medusa [Colletotrichum tofieldiae]
MAVDWSPEEWSNRRRIVMFNKKQTGSTLTTTFRPVNVNERPPNSICISCIWWAEKNECYVTSVDTIYLLEQLVVAPARFTVEEKNRIRRNLEGFRPLTVSKAKADSEEFFKIIMAFPNPKPRNIEKDVKVFPWKILESALKKIIGKYSASPSSTLPASHLLTPTPVSAYPPPLPTPPAPTVASDHVSASVDLSEVDQWQHTQLASVLDGATAQPVTGAHSSVSPTIWTTARRPFARSDGLRQPFDADPFLRQRTAHATWESSYTAHGPGRWDPTIPAMHAPTTYAEQYQSMSAHHGPSHQVYGGDGYGDGAQRA